MRVAEHLPPRASIVEAVPRPIPHEKLTQIAADLFAAVGAPPEEARLVACELVTSNLLGLDSHGVIRIPEYLELVASGSIVPGAAAAVDRRGATTAIVDCGLNFGAVGAHHAMQLAVEIARDERTACVVTRRCNHVGRLGAYAEAAAREGLVALATCNSPIHGHFVLPWGGREGRLATNPLAYAVPTGGEPIVCDISTSVVPEGKIRLFKNQNKPLPAGWVNDAAGEPTTDAARFYGPPMGGILPLGGPAGHKGFALGLLVEILSSTLAGLDSTDATLVGNGICFITIDPAAFMPLERFRQLTDSLVAYIKSSPPMPGVAEVLVPGEIESRTRRERSASGITVDDVTWQAILDHARRLNVAIGL